MVFDLAALPHHDGSSFYVDGGQPKVGDTIAVRLRVPTGFGAVAVHIRSVIDGEPHYDEASCDVADATIWHGEIELHSELTHYRFLVVTAAGHRWVNDAGTFAHDVPDELDFRISTFDRPPDWLADTVVYQIFPDRFARGSDDPIDAPGWADVADWDTPVLADGRKAVFQLYGGDLGGIRAHLDDLVDLGINLIYLTPVFPARSSHRYDASTFTAVDPLLGGDDALVALTAAAHERGIRVIGDLTTNHTGDTHEWFVAAQADANSPEAGFYYFDEHPDDYVGWFGLKSLPKLDHRNDELRRRLVDGPDSVVARWHGGPAKLDGWRIDVANMTGRLGTIDRNHQVATAIRATMAATDAAEGRQSWLVAEHNYDASADLHGDGWHGTMAYTWFTRPVWRWLATPGAELMGVPAGVDDLPGDQVVAAFQAMTAGIPWPAVCASLTLLDSHDTSRFASVARSPAHHQVALGLLFTMPGVPMLFAGDEVGVRGPSSDLARQQYPWDRADWDEDLLATCKRLIAQRKELPALRHGSLRWVAADTDYLAFVRETAEQTVLVHAARAAHEPVTVDLDGRTITLAADAPDVTITELPAS